MCSNDLTKEHRNKVINSFSEENANKKEHLKKNERQKQKQDDEESKLTIKLEEIKKLELDRYHELEKKINDLQSKISSIEEKVKQQQIKLSEKSKLVEKIENHKSQITRENLNITRVVLRVLESFFCDFKISEFDYNTVFSTDFTGIFTGFG